MSAGPCDGARRESYAHGSKLLVTINIMRCTAISSFPNLNVCACVSVCGSSSREVPALGLSLVCALKLLLPSFPLPFHMLVDRSGLPHMASAVRAHTYNGAGKKCYHVTTTCCQPQLLCMELLLHVCIWLFCSAKATGIFSLTEKTLP
jgi:hypothetical protein